MRIKKQIRAMQEDGHALEILMMVRLPSRVLQDIIEEEAITILSEYKYINMNKLKSEIAKRCVPILKNTIKYEAFND